MCVCVCMRICTGVLAIMSFPAFWYLSFLHVFALFILSFSNINTQWYSSVKQFLSLKYYKKFAIIFIMCNVCINKCLLLNICFSHTHTHTHTLHNINIMAYLYIHGTYIFIYTVYIFNVYLILIFFFIIIQSGQLHNPNEHVRYSIGVFKSFYVWIVFFRVTIKSK